MERTLKIFLSCSFGAAIGTIVALGANHYFWWFGLIVGGLTGYLSYEFKKLVRTTAEGYKRLTERKPDKEYWKTYGLLALVNFHFLLIAYSILFFILSFIGEDFIQTVRFSNVMFIIFFLYFVIRRVPFPFDGVLYKEQKAEYYIDERRKLKTQLKNFNFFAVYFYWLPRGIFFMITKIIPKAILFLARFAKTVFLLIHSDIRLLCGMDAAIGAGIGYFTGSIIVGTFAGGILGAIQYEIVSKRLLHLNAKTT